MHSAACEYYPKFQYCFRQILAFTCTAGGLGFDPQSERFSEAKSQALGCLSIACDIKPEGEQINSLVLNVL